MSMEDAFNAGNTSTESIFSAFTRATSDKDIDTILERMAAEKLNETTEGDYLSRIAANTGRNKPDLRKAYKSKKKGATLLELDARTKAALQPYVDKYAVVNVGGGAFIVDKRNPQTATSQMTDKQFVKLHADDRYEYRDGNEKVVVKWAALFVAEPPMETEFYREGLAFDPRPGAYYENKLNTYRGFKLQPKAGDWSLYRELIRDVLCGGDEQLCQYVIEHLMHIVARPWEKCITAIGIQGRQGAGKTLVFELLKDILGDMLLHVEDSELVLGHFNEAVAGKLAILLDEAAFAGNVGLFAKLKHRVTADTVWINGKGKPVYKLDNYARMYFISNEDKFLHIDPDDRRYTILTIDEDAAERWKRENKYTKLIKQWRNGGAEGFLHDALHHEFRTREDGRVLIQFNYLTRGHAEQISQSRRGMRAVVGNLLIRGSVEYRTADGLVHPFEWCLDRETVIPTVELHKKLEASMTPDEKKNGHSLKSMLSAFKSYGIELAFNGRSGDVTERVLPSRQAALQAAFKKNVITPEEFEAAGGVTMH